MYRNSARSWEHEIVFRKRHVTVTVDLNTTKVLLGVSLQDNQMYSHSSRPPFFRLSFDILREIELCTVKRQRFRRFQPRQSLKKSIHRFQHMTVLIEMH